MGNFLKRLLGIKNDNYEDIENIPIINLINYHYNVDNIYDDMVIVNLDVDSCNIERGQLVKLLNTIYEVHNTEFIPSNTNFRYKLCLIKQDNEK